MQFTVVKQLTKQLVTAISKLSTNALYTQHKYFAFDSYQHTYMRYWWQSVKAAMHWKWFTSRANFMQRSGPTLLYKMAWYVLCFESCLSFETYNPLARKDYESNYRFGKIAHSVISCLLCSGDSYDDVDRGIWDIELLHGFGGTPLANKQRSQDHLRLKLFYWVKKNEADFWKLTSYQILQRFERKKDHYLLFCVRQGQDSNQRRKFKRKVEIVENRESEARMKKWVEEKKF